METNRTPQSLGELGIQNNIQTFFECIANGNTIAVKLFLESGMSPNSVLTIGYQSTHALIIALRPANYLEMIKLLVDKGSDVNATDQETGSSLLSCTVAGGATELVDFLLSQNAKTDIKDKSGNTVIDNMLQSNYVTAAYKQNKAPIIDLFLKHRVLTQDEAARIKKSSDGFIDRVKTFDFMNPLNIVILISCLAFLIVDTMSISGRIFTIIGFILTAFIFHFLYLRSGGLSIAKNAKYLKVGFLSAFLLMFFIGYSNKDFVPTSNRSSNSHKCGYCNNTFTGNGWGSVNGDQFEYTSWSGYAYCSKKCAYESQPRKWK